MADEEWIERLARSLCREAGLDPDAAIFASDAVTDAAMPGLGSFAETRTALAWTAYIARAQAHVTAARALKMI